jgi:hypothetical protein
VSPLLDDDAARLHRRFAAIRIALVELARRARSGPHTDDRLFVGPSPRLALVPGRVASPCGNLPKGWLVAQPIHPS